MHANKTEEVVKPKFAPSAYVLFCKEKRAEVQAENKDATFVEMGKLLGAKWTKMNESDKAVSY
jgi:hypothetical protein